MGVIAFVCATESPVCIYVASLVKSFAHIGSSSFRVNIFWCHGEHADTIDSFFCSGAIMLMVCCESARLPYVSIFFDECATCWVHMPLGKILFTTKGARHAACLVILMGLRISSSLLNVLGISWQ